MMRVWPLKFVLQGEDLNLLCNDEGSKDPHRKLTKKRLKKKKKISLKERKKKMNANEPLMKYRKCPVTQLSQKGRTQYFLKRRTESLQNFVRWHSVLRWHQLLSGVRMELGNHHLNAKVKSLKREKLKETTDVRAWGGVACSSEEASVMEVEQRSNTFRFKLHRNLEKGRDW